MSEGVVSRAEELEWPKLHLRQKKMSTNEFDKLCRERTTVSATKEKRPALARRQRDLKRYRDEEHRSVTLSLSLSLTVIPPSSAFTPTAIVIATHDMTSVAFEGIAP